MTGIPMKASASTVGTLGRVKKLFWAIGAALFAVGLIGVWDRIQNGHRGAAYNNVIVWGQWVANYIFFSGLSAGAYLISTVVFVFDVKRFERVARLAIFTALVTLLLALVSIAVDLGHMERAWEVLVYANFRSPMAWMIYLYSLFLVILVAQLWLIVRGRGGTGASAAADRRVVRRLAFVGLPVAILFNGGVGALFGTVSARPHWNSGLFPILFLLSALVSGGAVLTVAAAVFQDGPEQGRELVVDLGRLVLKLLAFDVLFQASEILVALRSGIPGHLEPLALMLTGPYSAVFWVVQVGIGVVVPILLLAGPSRRKPLAVAFACACVALGIYGLRLNIVIPGLATEELHGLLHAVSTPRISASYFPSATEWLLSMAVLGLGFLLFGAGELLLPKDNLAHEE